MTKAVRQFVLNISRLLQYYKVILLKRKLKTNNKDLDIQLKCITDSSFQNHFYYWTKCG